MAAFRKRLLVVALVLAALGLTGAPTAAFTPGFPSGDTATVAQSHELLGDTDPLIPFVFVANPGGFDTGLGISNTTRNDKGNTAKAGTCTLYNFGSTASGGAAPPQQTSAVVPAGGQTPASSSSLTASRISPTGSVVSTIAESYLALVVPQSGAAGVRFVANGQSLGR